MMQGMSNKVVLKLWRLILLVLPFAVIILAAPVDTSVLSAQSESFVMSNDQFFLSVEVSRLDIKAFLLQVNPALATTVVASNGEEALVGDIIEYYSYYYMINPQVLLTILELDNSLISRSTVDSSVNDWFPEKLGDLVSELHDAYYERLYRSDSSQLIFTDGETLEISEGTNAASYAILRYLASHHSKETWERSQIQVINDWRYAFDRLISQTREYGRELNSAPQSFDVDPLILPWETTHPDGWRYNKTPHNWNAVPGCPECSGNQPHSSLDFGIPIPEDCSDGDGDTPMDEWVVAAGDGVVVYSGYSAAEGGKVIIDHGDGFWTHYLHLGDYDEDLIPPLSQFVEAGTRLGHPACVPNSTGIHLHFAVSADEQDGYVSIVNTILSGWQVIPTGRLVRLGEELYPYNHIDNSLPDVAPTTLHRHANQVGHTVAFYSLGYPDSNSNFDVPSWFDNEASSIVLPNGLAATLYEHPNTGGASINLFGSFSDFAGQTFSNSEVGLNDNVSSIKIGQYFCSESLSGAPRQNKPVIGPFCEPPPTTDEAAFIADVTIPDGTVVSPGQSLVKTWRMKNTGSATWGSGYELVFVSGEQMGATASISVPTTSPEQIVDLSVNITAPTNPGNHTGYWRLRNPYGTYFGPIVWVSITVPEEVTPPPPDEIALACLGGTCPATVAPGSTFRPTVRAEVHSGQLLETRGDMLRNTDGNLFGAWPHIAVVGTVNPGGSYDFSFYEDNPITAPLAEGTYETKWRIWRDGNWAGPEITIQFQVTQSGGTNYPPNPPSLMTPGDWAVFDGITPTLCAQHNGDPDGDSITHYQFDIFESAEIRNSGWITNDCWTPNPPLGNYGYQWRAKVRDEHGTESNWSAVRHFNIEDPTLQIYSFTWQWCHEPWGSSEQICFCADTNAGALRLQVNSATDGSENGDWQILNELGVPDYECNDDDDRPPNWTQLEYEAGTHLVRLFAQGEGGWESATTADLLISLPSERRPNTPFGQYPQNHSYVDSQTVSFDWLDTLRTTSYQFQASIEPDFDPLLVDVQLPVGTSEYTYSFAEAYEDVYWRVIAAGPYGTNASSRSFHIDTVPPASSVISLPPVTTENFFGVQWSGTDARSGVRWYDIQVREGNRSDSEWQDWLVNTTQTAAIFLGQPGNTYYFRVRAMDEIGNWEAWPGGDGDTFTYIDLSAIPPSPWWDTSYSWKRNLVVLNNDLDALPLNYPMHIHFDATTTPTAAEIYNASLSAVKGNDVRVIYNNQVELDRFIQRFTPSQVDIWFPLQAQLNGGQTDDSSYQLYYGSPSADNPPANINSVFLPKNDSNTVGLWHFQDGTGNIVTDSSGNAHHGTFYAANWTDGWLGTAGLFNGSSGYVDIGDSDAFNLGSGPMTIEAWIYLTDSTGDYPHLVSKWGPGDGSYFLRINGDEQPNWLLRASGGNRSLTSNEELDLNTWYHIAATYNGSNIMRIYVNGELRGTKTDAADAFDTTRRLFIGWAEQGADGGHFPGYIQHVRISNVERTSFNYGRVDVAPTVVAGAQMGQQIPGTADLVLLSLATYPNLEGGVVVQAVFENQADYPTQNGLSTDLYLNEIPTGPGDYSSSIRFWVNDPIAAASTVTLTTVVTDLSNLVRALNLSPGGQTNGTLYAQVDSTGVISETDDLNNIYTAGTPFCLANADAYEPDDTFHTASPIFTGDIQTHNFDSLGDTDWISFSAQAGTSYTLKTSRLGDRADTYLYLYDQDGVTELAANDDHGGTLASQIVWTAPASGTYYAAVRHWNPNIAGCSTQYEVQINTNAVYLPIMLGFTTTAAPAVEINSNLLPAGFGWVAQPVLLPHISRLMRESKRR